jgi:hypothetical protein
LITGNKDTRVVSKAILAISLNQGNQAEGKQGKDKDRRKECMAK